MPASRRFRTSRASYDRVNPLWPLRFGPQSRLEPSRLTRPAFARTKNPQQSQTAGDCCGGQSRDRTDDLPLFRRTLVPTELPGRKVPVDDEPKPLATLTGLEPATSAVTGRRANQLRHRALLNYLRGPRYRVPRRRTPYGIRTRATALKGRRPRPLDEGGRSCSPLGARIAYDRSRANHKSTGQTHKLSIATSSTTRTPRVTFAPSAHVVNSSTPRLAGALPL